MAAVLDYMARPERFLPALVAVLVLQALINAGLPERVASVGGYRGTLTIFRFDQAIFHTPEYASDLKDYDKQGREQVVVGHVLWDIATPLLYALGLAGLIGFLAPHTGPAGPVFLALRWIPIAAAAVDILENVAISVICLSYPNVYGPALTATGFLTHLKWILVGSALASAGFGVVAAVVAAIRR